MSSHQAAQEDILGTAARWRDEGKDVALCLLYTSDAADEEEV